MTWISFKNNQVFFKQLSLKISLYSFEVHWVMGKPWSILGMAIAINMR